MFTKCLDLLCKFFSLCFQLLLITGRRLLPTVFLPLSLLSFSSVLGILSSVALIAVVLIDGFYKVSCAECRGRTHLTFRQKEAPGSLWEPAPTSFGPESAMKLGVSFGLFMAGVSPLFFRKSFN